MKETQRYYLRQGDVMKRLVLRTIVTGTTIFTLVGLFVAACGSTPPVGAGGTTGGGGGVGGVVISTTTPTGTAGSTSGGGSTGSTPTTEVNCGTQTSDTSQEPADVLLVLDRSGSMDESIAEECYCDPAKATGGGVRACSNTASCAIRWATLTSAVNTTIASTTGIHWGLKFFSTPGGTGRNASCNVSTAVEVAVGAANAASDIQTQIADPKNSPANNTPTAAAITAATTYLKTVNDSNNKVILLATDGEPNCKAGGNSGDSDVQGTVTAIGAALAAGFKVYVIGIGPSVGNLDNFAQAGGTTKSFPATSPQDLTAALASISKAVTTCTFALAKAPPDPNNIAVYLDKNLVAKDPTNGWTLGGNSQTVVLNGTTCDKITSGQAHTVQVLFGCAGSPPPPTTIP